jgi:hypothetical protein
MMLCKLCCVLLLEMASAHGTIVAQSIKVLVLDAVSGKPQVGVEVHYFCQDEHRNYFPVESETTNAEGVAIVPYACGGENPTIHLFVTALRKEECGDIPGLQFEEIVSRGFISAPDGEGEMHCGTKISRKLKPTPGQVAVFIKKPSWWQARFGSG